jgi:hypothetical protein
VPTTGVTAPPVIARQGVFMPRFVTSVAYVALPIPCLVSVEVVKLLFSAPWQRSMVPVTRIVAVVDMAVKAGMAVKPGPSSDKDPTQKPIGSVVAVRCAVIGSVVEVPVRANRGNPNADCDLGSRRHRRSRTEQCDG